MRLSPFPFSGKTGYYILGKPGIKLEYYDYSGKSVHYRKIPNIAVNFLLRFKPVLKLMFNIVQVLIVLLRILSVAAVFFIIFLKTKICGHDHIGFVELCCHI